MITLDEARANIGRAVRYRSSGGEKTDYGEISSVGGSFVFVRYVGFVAATDPKDLTWLVPREGDRA